jgi:hypothetical protein
MRAELHTTPVRANVDVMQFLNNGDFKGGKTFLARIKRKRNKKFLTLLVPRDDGRSAFFEARQPELVKKFNLQI